MQTLAYVNPAGARYMIPIYWHDEAEEIISALARRYAADVTPVSRGGRNRNKKYYYNSPAAFDIETTTIRPGAYGYEHPDGRPLAFPYLFQFALYGVVIMCRTYAECMDIFNWLSDYFIGGRNRQLIIYDHNLGYEYGFLRDLWPVNGKQSFAIDEHHPVTLQLENGLLLRDSYKMTNMSLETLTRDWSEEFFKAPEIMDYRRQRTPYTDLDDDTILYSALDVLSLCDSIVHYLDAQHEYIWTKNPTSTSFIRSGYKAEIGIGSKRRTPEQRRYFDLLRLLRMTPDIYEIHLRQVRGGNTHSNRRYTGAVIGDERTGCGVGHWDIGSSYPAQIVCYPEYAIGAWRPLGDDCPLDTIKLFERNGYVTIFDVVLINPRIKEGVTVPYIATAKSTILKGSPDRLTDNGRYLSGAEMLKTTIFGIEWPIIEKQYDYDDVVILGGYYAPKGYLPDVLRKYVLKLYAQKTQLKGVSGKEIEYALSKTYVNGVYGMMLTRVVQPKYLIGANEITRDAMPDIAQELEKYQRRTSYFLNYSWGAMVATLGRVYLQKMIDAAGEYFLYCDTDSIFASHPEIVRPRIKALEKEICEYQRQCGLQLIYNDMKGRPHELGSIDEESECAFKTFGAKKYAEVRKNDLKVHSTIAGVPKEAGARIIGSTLDGFRLGMTFEGSETNKLCLWYNDDAGITIYDDGRPIRCYANVAMLPVDYYLSLSADYEMCLMMEGINETFAVKTAQPNMNEEYI